MPHSIKGANARPDVTCVVGVDTNDRWGGDSSEGPAIAIMEPDKPDLAAYRHSLGSEVGCNNSPDTGTSAAGWDRNLRHCILDSLAADRSLP